VTLSGGNILVILISAGSLQLVWEVFKYFRGGEKRKQRIDSARAEMEASLEKDKAPFVIEALRLGNFERAVALQMTIITRQEQTLDRQDREMKEQDSQIAELKRAVDERDGKIRTLEEQMRRCSAHIEELERAQGLRERG
jgi:hypothetical protein